MQKVEERFILRGEDIWFIYYSCKFVDVIPSGSAITVQKVEGRSILSSTDIGFIFHSCRFVRVIPSASPGSYTIQKVEAVKTFSLYFIHDNL